MKKEARRQKTGEKPVNKGLTRKRRITADQQKRMTSITRKLHWMMLRSRIGRYLWWDFLTAVLLAVGWCADQELTKLKVLVWNYGRAVRLAPGGRNLFYTVTSREGELLLRVSCVKPLRVLVIAVGCMICCQAAGIIFDYFREDKKIRAVLAPINEIALKADELSRMSFSEDKYQQIEEAIENIRPGEETPLSFGDSDLSGVEAAMNNLLLRMRDSYRQQARFVNDASHELRTPIAVIQGYANMLDRWGKTDEKILEEGITAIKNESEHMSHLVEQLLFLARGDSGKTALKLETVQLDGMMQEIYEESFMIDETHRYRLAPCPEKIMIRADSALLKQAVRILIDNAAKYTPAGDEILLSCGRTAQGEPYLQVQDTGIGMAESEIPHIFERFFRSDEVRSSSGTGLGLSIAKWIVDKHKGHFEVLSRQELGTRIRILLPAQE